MTSRVSSERGYRGSTYRMRHDRRPRIHTHHRSTRTGSNRRMESVSGFSVVSVVSAAAAQSTTADCPGIARLDHAATELLSRTPRLAARPPCEFKLRALSEPGVAMTERAVVIERMGRYVLGFQEIDQTQVAVVGGKGAHLGELSRIEGVRVPVGFCVTTDAFQRIMAEAPSIRSLYDRLDRLSRL